MSIQHYQFQKALAHFAANIQRNKPQDASLKHLVLTQAIIRSGGSVWKFSSSIMLDIPSTMLIAGERPFVDFVKLNDIKNQIDISTNNDVIDVFGVHKAIEIADQFIKNNQEIVEAALMYLLNESSPKEKIWKLEYQCNYSKGEKMFLIAIVNVDTDELVSTEIERVESNEK